MTSLWLIIGLMAILLLAKGFFSGSEIAMISADRVRLRARAARGDRGAKTALRLMREPARLLTTTLLGTNIVSIALTTLGTLAMVQAFGETGQLVAVLVFTPLFLILGEIVPKSVYQQKADSFAPVISEPLAVLQLAFAPLVWLFSGIAALAARLVGHEDDGANAAREQVLATVQMAEKTGANAAFERGQVSRVLRFAQMSVGEVMWPLAKVEILPRNAEIADIVAARHRTAQRLVPLYERDRRFVTGVAVVEGWDLLDPGLLGRDVESILGEVLFVPEERPVNSVIDLLHTQPAATVIVVDHAGQALGLVTLGLLVRRALGARIDPVVDPGCVPLPDAPA